jgi:hypothetical protein
MPDNSFMNMATVGFHSEVIAHSGIINPLATGDLCCSFCGSTRDLRYTRKRANEITCGICGNTDEPIPKSAFEAAQLRDR